MRVSDTHNLICSGEKPWNIHATNCGVKISATAIPARNTVVITVMITEKVFSASASRFSARNRV